jgi:N-acetylmuramoyl-L-alanine amidase
MPARVTRRDALAGSAVLALSLVPGRAAAVTRRAPADAAVDLTIPIPASSFRRRAGDTLLTTPPLRSPRRLAVLGLRWRAPRGARVELRTRTQGRWSGWVALPSAAGHGPDHARQAPATEPAIVAGARVFQLRATHALDDLRAHGVALERPAIARAARRALVPRSAAEVPAAVIPRSAWGAQVPRESPSYGQVVFGFVHHTVSTNDYTQADSPAIVKAIQQYHRNTLGWNDIGYQLLVDRYGQVFEGRAGGIDQAVIGAQAQGYNAISTGVAMIGTHTSEGITPEAFETLAAVLAWKLPLHGVPTEGEVTVTSAGGSLNRYPTGRRVLLQRISGHRDGDATECPGNALYAQLPALRTRASQLAVRTGLGFTVLPRTVAQGQVATASGWLAGADGTPAPGVQVELQEGTAQGWRTLTTATTDAGGAWSAQVALPYSRTLRARGTIDPLAGPLVSPSVRLEVRSAIRAVIGPQHLRVGRRVVVKGSVQPLQPRRRLVVTLERRAAHGRYRRVARFGVTAKGGRFRVPIVPSRSGLYRVRVSVRADRLNASTRTPYLFARARR